MSGTMIQATRKAQNIAAAAEAMREAGMPTARTDEALAEPLIGDDHVLAALMGDMAEGFAQVAGALNHTIDHVIPSQDAELARLRESVGGEKPKEEEQPKRSPATKGRTKK